MSSFTKNRGSSKVSLKYSKGIFDADYDKERPMATVYATRHRGTDDLDKPPTQNLRTNLEILFRRETKQQTSGERIVVKHAHRVERLVHTELKEVRYEETGCKGCGERHIEWR